jgi:Ca2+-binding RTX toxin-like protein
MQQHLPGKAWAAETLVSIEDAVGGAGNDQLIGSGVANTLDGGAGNDTVRAAAGNDTLLLSRGTDQLDGGAGTDTIAMLMDYSQYPELSYSEYWDFATYVEYDGPVDDTILIDLKFNSVHNYYDGSSGSVRNIENVITGIGNDRVLGSDAANVIDVGHGANSVDGRAGNDRIYGGNAEKIDVASSYYFTDIRDASEVVHGGAGNDTLIGASNSHGDAGNDTLVAGWKHNNMTGGLGADHFVFSDLLEAEEYHGYWIEVQRGRILDFNSSGEDEGDKIVIDRVDKSPPDPEYAGHVSNSQDIDIGQFGIVQNQSEKYLFMPLFHDDQWDWNEGLRVDLVNHSWAFSEGDVIFL